MDRMAKILMAGCASMALTVSVTAPCRGQSATETGRIAPAAEAGEGPGTGEELEMLVRGNTAFALDLYGRLRQEPGNLFISPLSISTALGMTYAGARGQTAKEMADVLHFELSPELLHPTLGGLSNDLAGSNGEDGYELSLANALWGQKGYGFLQSFLDMTREHYGSGLHEVDFIRATEEARKTINRWAEEETHGKIVDLLRPGILTSLTRLVLTNAIYFKGAWQSPFKEESTRDAPFTLLDGKKTTVPMMNQTDRFGYLNGEGFQLLTMPYAGERFAMVLFLPDEVDGLPAFETSLTAEKLTAWLQGTRRSEVIVSVPKFKLTYDFALGRTLKEMGMPTPFSAEADFSGMNGKKDLSISEVIHKAFVEVSEEGTEAAAATAVTMALTSAPVREVPPVFRADHPFLFMIRDLRTNSVLFLGRVMDPSSPGKN